MHLGNVIPVPLKSNPTSFSALGKMSFKHNSNWIANVVRHTPSQLVNGNAPFFRPLFTQIGHQETTKTLVELQTFSIAWNSWNVEAVEWRRLLASISILKTWKIIMHLSFVPMRQNFMLLYSMKPQLWGGCRKRGKWWRKRWRKRCRKRCRKRGSSLPSANNKRLIIQMVLNLFMLKNRQFLNMTWVTC